MRKAWLWLLIGGCSTGNSDAPSAEAPPAHQSADRPAPAAPESPPGELELVGEKAENPKSILIVSWDTVRQDMAGHGDNPGITALQAQEGTVGLRRV